MDNKSFLASYVNVLIICQFFNNLTKTLHSRQWQSTVNKMNTLIWNLGALDEFFCKQPVNMQCIEMWRTIHRGQCTSPLFLLDPLYRGRVYKWKFCTFVLLFVRP